MQIQQCKAVPNIFILKFENNIDIKNSSVNITYRRNNSKREGVTGPIVQKGVGGE
jgi:hypothetical protein